MSIPEPSEAPTRPTPAPPPRPQVPAAEGAWRAIAEAARGPMLVVDDGLRARFANRAFLKAFAVEPGSIPGASVYELGRRRWDTPSVRRLFEEILPALGSVEDLAVELRPGGPGPQALSVNARRFDPGGGAGVLTLLAVEDATPDPAPARRILESVRDVSIFATDLDGVVTAWTAGAERLFGHRAGEIVGRPAELLLPPEDRARDAIEAANAAAEPRWHLRRDGGRFLASRTVAPLLDDAGTPIGFTVVHRDVTARVEADRERDRLAAQVDAHQRLLDAVFEALPIGLAYADPGGRLARMNRANLELWNDPPATGSIAEYAGWEGYRAGSTVRVEPHEWPLARILTTGEPVEPELYQIGRFHGGGRRDVLISGASVRDADGTLIAGVVALVDVSAAVRAEARLRESEEKYRTLFESIDEGFCVIDVLFDDAGRAHDWVYLEMNPAYEKHTGRRAAVGRTTREVAPGMDPHWFEFYGRVARTGEPGRYSNEVRSLGGQWFEVYAFRLGGPGTTRVAVLFNNITATRLVQIENGRLAAIVASSDDAILSKDLDGIITSWNGGAERIFGASAAEMIGRPVAVLVPDDLLGEEEEILRRIRQGERVELLETRRRTRDGRVIDVAVTVSPILDGGRVVGASKVARDITERRRLQEQIRARGQHFESVADHAPAILWTTAPDGSNTFLSRRWFETTGQREGDASGVGWIEAVLPEDREATLQGFLEANRLRVPFSCDYRLRQGDGSYRWSIDSGLPRFAPDGTFLGYVGLVVDIDDRKRAEQQAERARAEAEEANRAKDEFLATLSHELRTPLNAIVGWAKILKSGPVDPEDVAEAIEVIDRNGQAQSRLIEDLLDVSRITSGRLRLDVQPVDLAGVIDAAVAAVAPAAVARGVRLARTVDPAAGPIQGDPARLQQVAWNLLTNAVKFTPRGGDVALTMGGSGSHVEIRVADTGMGIGPDFLPHVFDRFRQADSSTTRRYGGLGLGLAIVKHIVEMHGGTIRAESPGEGQGSTFIVALPVAAAPPGAAPADADAGPAADLPAGPAGSGSIAGLRVLIVDDDPDARQMVQRALSDGGAAVEVAGSAAEALESLGRSLPDVLVSDIGMPDQDGYDLIRRVRESIPAKQVPAVALTAFARPEDRRRALLAGFQSHVAKPVDPAELAAVVASLAGRTG